MKHPLQVDRLLLPTGYSKDMMWEQYGSVNMTLADAAAMQCSGKDLLSAMSTFKNATYYASSFVALYGLKSLLT
jgi:hypothetical protein